MNKFVFVAIGILCSFCINFLQAQSDSAKLFYAKKFDSKAFVELGSNFIQINDGAGTNIDFSLNWVVNNKYYVGAAYSQLASLEERFVAFESGESDTLRFNQQTMGLRLGYILFHDHKIVSFSPDLTVGWANFKFPDTKDFPVHHYAFLTPALKAVFNVSNYFRVGAALHYRVNVGLDEPYIQTKDLSGVGGGIFMRIGKF